MLLVAKDIYMESVGVRKRRRTEAGLAYDNSLKKSRSLSEFPDENRSTLLRIEYKPTDQEISNKNSTGDIKAVEAIGVAVEEDGEDGKSETNIRIIEDGDSDSAVDNEDNDALIVNEINAEAGLEPRSCSTDNAAESDTDSELMPEGKSACLFTNYSLNENAACIKKISACDRENCVVERKSHSDSITFNTTSFEIFRKCFDQYYDTHKKKFKVHSTPVIAGNNLIVQDIVRVSDLLKRNVPLIYTVNIYRTTSRLMVNGPHYRNFTDNDLPLITCLINQEDEDIRECNQILQKQLYACISDLPTNSNNWVTPSSQVLLSKHESTTSNEDIKATAEDTIDKDDTINNQHSSNVEGVVLNSEDSDQEFSQPKKNRKTQPKWFCIY